MISALALASFAALLALLARRLPAAAWPNTAPRAAIGMWQLIASTWALALFLCGATLLFPALHLSEDLASLIGACSPDLRAHYGTPFGRLGAVLGGVTAVAVAGRATYFTARTRSQVRADRARHRTLVALARHRPAAGVVVVDQPTPLAYCMPRPRPGRPHTIVVSTEAVRRLSAPQLRAVIAHETSHLRRHHHRTLNWLFALTAAFPWVTVLRLARSEVARLTELHADDIARRTEDPIELAEALIAMSQTSQPSNTARVPEGAEQPDPLGRHSSLGIVAGAGEGVVDRVRRLITPPAPMRPRQMLAIVLCAVGIVSAPLVASVTPALTAHNADQVNGSH